MSLGVGLCGCGGQQKDELPYHKLVAEVLDPNRISLLDTPQSEILSSYDRTGGNNDYSNYLREGPGDWKVLADLKGPGYISRFWTTGGHSRQQRFRFYFDDEKKPRIDATVETLRTGAFPFLSGLSRYEQGCWWSYVPIPYSHRLVIMGEMERPPHLAKFFWQVNYSSLDGKSIQSFPRAFTEADRQTLEAANRRWTTPPYMDEPFAAPGESVRVEAGTSAILATLLGPAVIRRMEVALAADPGEPVAKQETAIRQCTLRVSWDGGAPSIEMPLVEFCGRVWDCPGYDAMYLGFRDNVYTVRFPMPFREAARFELINHGPVALDARVRLNVEAGQWIEGEQGYLHAVARASSPRQVGQSHTILHATGRGKFAGCVLGALSLDNSWWLLESDERIRIDDETQPGWHGTGLEDYFNGAWYYKNVLTRPLHGLVQKIPFRTVQYRLHGVDARTFSSAIDVAMERGPNDASRGWLASVAYYYLATPHAAQAGSTRAQDFVDPLEQATIMSVLTDYERLGDYAGAMRYVDAFLARHPDLAYAPVLRLRKIATVERLQGIEVARPLYEAFLESEDDPTAKQLARLLLWFHESPDHAILSLFCSPPTRAYLDDKLVGTTTDSRLFYAFPVRLTPGRHVLAIETTHRRYPDWVQACLRTHDGMLVTGDGWRFGVSPVGPWKQADFDDSSWVSTGNVIREGPPSAPDVMTSVHPFVDMQSMPIGIWGPKWPREERQGVFRGVFDHPLAQSTHPSRAIRLTKAPESKINRLEKGRK
jgi:hypothetical protein